MAVVTICSDFGTEGNKICHCFHFSLMYLPLSDGTKWCDRMMWSLVFGMLSFKPASSLFSFTFIKRLFSSSLLSAIRIVSSAYLRLLIFLLEILTPVYASSSLAFCMIYSAYSLNKQDDNIQLWHTPFPILNQSILDLSLNLFIFPDTNNPRQNHNKINEIRQAIKCIFSRGLEKGEPTAFPFIKQF